MGVITPFGPRTTRESVVSAHNLTPEDLLHVSTLVAFFHDTTGQNLCSSTTKSFPQFGILALSAFPLGIPFIVSKTKALF